MIQGFKILEIDPTLEPLYQKMQNQEASEQLKSQTEDQILFFKEVSYKPCYLDQYKNLRNNQFVEAVRLSYQYHVPLILSPDDLWLVISQGFDILVNMNAEQLRKQFANFDGKKNLTIFEPSVQSIKWPDMFKEFSKKIKENVGDSFSIDNPIFQAVQEIQLMDSLQSYFSYGIVCMCGIPKVKFLGTLDDWLRLREATLQLAQFDLNWWISKLISLLDKLIEEYKDDKEDMSFWKNIYQMRYGMGSVSPPQIATGWIQKQRKHLQNIQKNLMKLMKVRIQDSILIPKYQSIQMIMAQSMIQQPRLDSQRLDSQRWVSYGEGFIRAERKQFVNFDSKKIDSFQAICAINCLARFVQRFFKQNQRKCS